MMMDFPASYVSLPEGIAHVLLIYWAIYYKSLPECF